jgi:hypothetical protein
VRAILAACLAVIGLAVPAAGRAQIVNVLDKIKLNDAGFGGEVALSLGLQSGNTNLVTAKAALGVGYRYDEHLVFAIVRGEFGTKESIDRLSWRSFDKDLVYVSKIFEHLRYRYLVFEPDLALLAEHPDWPWWLELEGYAQHEADRFRDLATRVVVGAGPRVTVEPVAGLGLRVAFGTAYMFEHESYAKALYRTANTHRWSNYIQANYTLDKTFAFTETSIFQPRIAGVLPEVAATHDVINSDLRLQSDSVVSLTVTDWLKVKVALTVSYNSAPPPQPEDLRQNDDGLFTLVDQGQRKVRPWDVVLDTSFVLVI